MRIIVPQQSNPGVKRAVAWWPHESEIDYGHGVVLFYDATHQWMVGFTFADLSLMEVQGTPDRLRRKVQHELDETAKSHTLGGARVRRTEHSPLSIVVPRMVRTR